MLAVSAVTGPGVELMVTGIGLTLIAAVLCCSAVLAWTGRWRAWARRPVWGTLPLHLFPGLGLVSALGAVEAVLDLPDRGPMIDAGRSIVILVMMTGLVIWGLGVWGREPRWAQPAWLRAADRSPDIAGDALNAAIQVVATAGMHHRSRAVVEQAFAGQERLARWAAAHVVDPAATAPETVLSGVGTLDGRLVLYPEGLGFYPVAVEERIRDELDGCLLLASEELTAVWTVPGRTDAAGVRAPVPLRYRFQQGPYRRLVIATGQGAEVFQVAKAGTKADEIADRYRIERAPDIERPSTA